MSICIRFGAISHKRLFVFSTDLYAGWQKKCQPRYKNNRKTNVLKVYNSQTKSDRHKAFIKKKHVFRRAFSCSINNFELSLKSFNFEVTVNSAIDHHGKDGGPGKV